MKKSTKEYIEKHKNEIGTILELERTKNKEALIPYNSVIAVGDFIVVSEEDLL